jgi:hypothetical protein
MNFITQLTGLKNLDDIAFYAKYCSLSNPCEVFASGRSKPATFYPESLKHKIRYNIYNFIKDFEGR